MPTTPHDKEPGALFPTPPDLSDPSWEPVRSFLLSFPNTLFIYFADPDAELTGVDYRKKCPPRQTNVLDPSLQKYGYGIFYSVNGFKTPYDRAEADLKTINAFYVDIDYPKQKGVVPTEEQLNAFKRDALESLTDLTLADVGPNYIIETKNGLHAIWSLKRAIDLTKLEPDQRELCLTNYRKTIWAIIERLNGDPVAKDANRVLRLPNTWHLKDPAHPFLTKLIHSTSQRFLFKEIKDFFLKADETLNTKRLMPVQPDSHGLIWKNAAGKDEPLPPVVLKDLERLYPKHERPSVQALMDKDNRGDGNRNQSLMVACACLRQAGWSEAETITYFDHYNGLSAYEIKSVIKSVFRRAIPYEVGWNHPLIAEGITQAERAKVTAVVSASLADYKRKERAELKKQGKELKPPVDKPEDPLEKDEQVAEQAMKEERRAQSIDKNVQQKMFERYEKIIIERYPNLRYIKGNAFYSYENGAYTVFDIEKLQSLIVNEMDKDGLFIYRSKTSVDNKIMCLKAEESIQMEQSAFDAHPSYVNVSNGIVDIDTGELIPHSPDIFSLNQLKEITYRPDEDEHLLAPRWIQFIDEITQNDAEKAALLQEIAGYAFTRTVSFQRAFILYGSGANGKSTYMDTLMRILGEKNVSSLTLTDLNSQMMPYKLYGKTLNVIEEINNNYIESDFIKKAITGAEITANRKYMEPLIFRPYAKFFFAVNQLPKISDTSSGLYRRFSIIEFKASFERNGETGLAEKLWRERDGIFLWALKGWQRLKAQGKFTFSKEVAEATENFKESNSPLVEFLLQFYKPAPPGRESQYNIPAMNVFMSYQKQTKLMGYGTKNFQNFLRELQTLNHYELLNIKVIRSKGSFYMQGMTLNNPSNPFL